MLDQLEQNQLLQKLKILHSGDDKQLEVIFSTSKRLVVEAPAGYGKTKTMISKIAYLLATGRIPNPKKILALTFSVNAAYKIKKELSEQLPSLLHVGNSPQFKISDNLFVSNYHGFCRHILKKYGYLLHPNLANIDLLNCIDDSNAQEVTRALNVAYNNSLICTESSDAVKRVNVKYVLDHFTQYTDELIHLFLDKNYISFNGIIALTLKLFKDYTEVLQFYQSYFPLIIVDEFQDTNILSFLLVKKLVSEQSELIFMGDSLQRIYGFIGAIPNLIEHSIQLFSMERIALEKNYRFMSNQQMLQLDRNIRLNAENPMNPAIQTDTEVSLTFAINQLKEAEKIILKINELLFHAQERSSRIAILARQKGNNIDKIIEVLEAKGIPYFYALFSEDESDYLRFHRECSFRFTEQMRLVQRISTLNLKKFSSTIEESFQHNQTPVVKSLLRLLNIFLFKVLPNYSFLSAEDKLILIRDTFENRNLKQNMEYIEENIIISTIHGAKGLEWDYVFMPDMEKYSMPNWHGLCGDCSHKINCDLKVESKNEKKFLEELSVFYVGVTRARKQIFFSASKERLKADGGLDQTNLTCMLRLPGITLIPE